MYFLVTLKLRLATLRLFEALIDLQQEQILFCLVLKYLCPGYHISIPNAISFNGISKEDINSETKQKIQTILSSGLHASIAKYFVAFFLLTN